MADALSASASLQRKRCRERSCEQPETFAAVYVPHHMQRLSAAAVVGAAKMVRGAANNLKSDIMGPAYSAAAVGEHA